MDRKQLEMGREIPEPPGATVDPFWRDFPDELDQHDVRSMLYERGAQFFPLRILEKLWLEELQEVRLSEAEPSGGGPSKAALPHYDQWTPETEGDSRPAYLGVAGKKAWIEFDGPRADRGYRIISVVDKPPRAQAATIAALTILEASRIEGADFERLRKALLEHAERHQESKEKSLEEALDELPARWFADRKTALDHEIKALPAEEREKRFPKPWERWERSAGLWERSVRYMVALLRCRRPGFEGHTLEQQLSIVGAFRLRLNKFLEAQRSYVDFLKFRTAGAIKRTVKRAQDQVTAAVLCDVAGLNHRAIAKKMDIVVPARYEENMKIPEITRLAGDGRKLLGEVLETGRTRQGDERRVRTLQRA